MGFDQKVAARWRVVGSDQVNVSWPVFPFTISRRATIRGMSDHHMQLGLFITGCIGSVLGIATLGFLIWYAVETWKLRKAAQKQIEISQKLIDAAMDQVEGLSKPCLTFWGDLRDGADTILSMHGAVGSIVARQDNGNYVVHNIGNGVALNISYTFPRPEDDPARRSPRYMPNLLATGRATLIESFGLHNQTHTVVFEYESIGGRHYRSTIMLVKHVITSLKFEEIKP